jgi:hypothetical protein
MRRCGDAAKLRIEDFKELIRGFPVSGSVGVDQLLYSIGRI